jgi:NAD-dependent dihydropyrimidine dehydrogenase PreA subunit
MGDHGMWKGTPREQIPWFPTVDPEKCIGCRKCFEFCGHKVYAWDEAADRPVVAEPFQCVVGCSNCSHQCESEAITFPPLSILTGFMRDT